MKNKFFSFSLLIATLLTTQVYAANRCLEMIDKRVEKDKLDLSWCKIKTEDVSAVLSYLAKHSNIKSLDFSGNFIGSSAIISLAKNTTLTTLNVSNNEANVEGAKALAKKYYNKDT